MHHESHACHTQLPVIKHHHHPQRIGRQCWELECHVPQKTVQRHTRVVVHAHTHTHTNTRTQHTRPTVIEDLQGPKPQLAASRQRIIVRHCTNHIIDAAGTNRPFKQLTVAHAEDTSEVPPACRDLYPFACTRYALISPLFLCVRVYRLSEQASENNVNGPAALQAPDRAFEDYQGCYRPDY